MELEGKGRGGKGREGRKSVGLPLVSLRRILNV
jgi:hypothetical protein